MPIVESIHRRSTFQALRRPAARSRRGPVRVAYVPPVAGEGGPAQVGYAVGRRCGGAVARNRIRRRLRAALQSCASDLPAGAYLVATDPEALDVPYERLVIALCGAMESAGARGSRARGADGD